MAAVTVGPGLASPAPGLGMGPGPTEGADALFVALSAGITTLSHPLLYVKLLVQVGHEPLPPTVGRNLLGRKVLYLPGFFTYARHIVDVDGKRGLFRGLTPRIISSTLSTISRGRIKKAFPLEDMEHVSNKDDVKTSLRKVAKETSHEMMMQCASRVISHPLHVISVRCMVQFVGREVKYRGVFSSIGTIWKEEGLLGFFVGLVPHILGDIIFLWCCNLLAHFINTYAVDDNFNQASVIRSYTKFVMGIAVSMLTYPFLLVGDLMAVNNCGLLAGLHPYAPVFSSWIHCWKHLSAQLCALECSKGPLLFAYSMSSAPISGTVTHSSSKNRDVCLLMGSSELPNGEENWGSSSEVPACFFAEHPHQQPFLLTNHTWKEETNLIYHRRNPKSLL